MMQSPDQRSISFFRQQLKRRLQFWRTVLCRIVFTCSWKELRTNRICCGSSSYRSSEPDRTSRARKVHDSGRGLFRWRAAPRRGLPGCCAIHPRESGSSWPCDITGRVPIFRVERLDHRPTDGGSDAAHMPGLNDKTRPTRSLFAPGLKSKTRPTSAPSRV